MHWKKLAFEVYYVVCATPATRRGGTHFVYGRLATRPAAFP